MLTLFDNFAKDNSAPGHIKLVIPIGAIPNGASYTLLKILVFKSASTVPLRYLGVKNIFFNMTYNIVPFW